MRPISQWAVDEFDLGGPSKQFESGGPSGATLAIDQNDHRFRACLKTKGHPPACIVVREAPKRAMVRWTTAGLVWLEIVPESGPSASVGENPLWVWSVSTGRLRRTFTERRSRSEDGLITLTGSAVQLDASSARVESTVLELVPVNGGYSPDDCKGPPWRLLIRCREVPAKTSSTIDDLLSPTPTSVGWPCPTETHLPVPLCQLP